MELFYHNV
jgi:hypothetical protein